MNVDFSQFGPFAIVCILMACAVVYMITQNKEERRRTDEQINLRIQDQKDAKESSDKSMNEMLILMRQIYGLLTSKNDRRE